MSFNEHRRATVLVALLPALACRSATPALPPASPDPVPSTGVVIRISKASFPPEQLDRVRARLDASQVTLVPAVRGLRGCLRYWAAIDPVTSTMVNVSVWETLGDARQMETLAPMQALAGEFVALGVTFERPIANYDTLWQIGP